MAVNTLTDEEAAAAARFLEQTERFMGGCY
jgi:hypothetical protein